MVVCLFQVEFDFLLAAHGLHAHSVHALGQFVYLDVLVVGVVVDGLDGLAVAVDEADVCRGALDGDGDIAFRQVGVDAHMFVAGAVVDHGLVVRLAAGGVVGYGLGSRGHAETAELGEAFAVVAKPVVAFAVVSYLVDVAGRNLAVFRSEDHP